MYSPAPIALRSDQALELAAPHARAESNALFLTSFSRQDGWHHSAHSTRPLHSARPVPCHIPFCLYSVPKFATAAKTRICIGLNGNSGRVHVTVLYATFRGRDNWLCCAGARARTCRCQRIRHHISGPQDAVLSINHCVPINIADLVNSPIYLARPSLSHFAHCYLSSKRSQAAIPQQCQHTWTPSANVSSFPNRPSLRRTSLISLAVSSSSLAAMPVHPTLISTELSSSY
jgi:hypothetical protein